MPTGLVTFTRRKLDKPPNWRRSDAFIHFVKKFVGDPFRREQPNNITINHLVVLLAIGGCDLIHSDSSEKYFLCFSSKTLLTKLHITCKGTIEDDGYGMLQVRRRRSVSGGN